MVTTRRTTAGAAHMQPQCQSCLSDRDLSEQVLPTNALIEVLDAREYFEHPERPIVNQMAHALAYQALCLAEDNLNLNRYKAAIHYAQLAVGYINLSTGRIC